MCACVFSEDVCVGESEQVWVWIRACACPAVVFVSWMCVCVREAHSCPAAPMCLGGCVRHILCWRGWAGLSGRLLRQLCVHVSVWACVSACMRVQHGERELVVCASSLLVFQHTFLSLCARVCVVLHTPWSLRLCKDLFVTAVGVSVSLCVFGGCIPCVWRGELSGQLCVCTCVSGCACLYVALHT